MPSSKVYKIAEDRDGFLWFGTADGLARFDGVHFRVWRHDPTEPSSLASDDVAALFVDSENRLWCGGEDAGLNVLDAKRVGFKHFLHDPGDPASLSANDVWSIAEDPHGAVWVGTYSGGLDRMHADGRGFDHFQHDPAVPESLASNTVLNLMAASDGRLWIVTDKGLDRRELSGAFTHLDATGLLSQGEALLPLSLVEDAAGGVIVGTAQGLVHVDAAMHPSWHAPRHSGLANIYGLTRDNFGEIWAATRNGVVRLTSDGNPNVYTSEISAGGSPGNAVFDALRDHEGGLWFALLDGGVAALGPQWRSFSGFRREPDGDLGLSSNRIAGMAADSANGLWLVSPSGAIDHLEPGSGSTEHYSKRLPPMPEKRLWSVLADRRGRLWVGHQLGIRVYDLKTGHFSDVPQDPANDDALPAGFVDRIIEGPDGAIWGSVRGGGLARIDAESLHLRRYLTGAASGLRSADIEQISFDREGALLVASESGMDRLDLQSDRFTPLEGAPTQRIHAFAFSSDGTLWLHRLGALEHFALEQARARLLDRIGAADGWPSMRVGGLEIDRHGRLWISSVRGLLRMDPATRAIRRYDTHDGLPSSELRHSLQLADGRIFVTTLASGLIGFDAQNVIGNPIAPPVKLASLSLRRNGQVLDFNAPAAEFEVDWLDRDVRVQVSALSYANVGANRYQFQLAGFDSDWVDTAARGEREFGQLPAGSYDLRVRAANADGVWSETETVLRFAAAAPPWRTPLAYVLYFSTFSIFAILVLYGYRRRLARRYQLSLARQQREWAERANAAKSTFLATMAHEIRTPMTGVLGMAELLLGTALSSKQSEFAQAIQKSGNLMLQQVNDALDLARIEAGMLELTVERIQLRNLLHESAALLEPQAVRKGLIFTIRVAPDAPVWVAGDARRIQQVLLNLGNNAIKFTERGEVAVELCRGESVAVCFRVHDNGPGVTDTARARLFSPFVQADRTVFQRYGGTGLGLAICRTLATKMGGTITVERLPTQGSVFNLLLPLPELDAMTAPIGEEKPIGVNKNTILEKELNNIKGKYVLLVEDDATVAQVVAGLLEARGLPVRHAPHGLAALAELQQGDAVCALFDLDLPGVDGYELARMWRRHEKERGLQRLPLIAISASCNGDEENRVSGAGMDGFLRKPITGKDLMNVLLPLLKCYSDQAVESRTKL